ncbi:sulfite exporter TauE/SafE family protein [Sedimentibacter hydroxybenzoicus DSM 7310]|uniref:Sulfite exporter TauE/SafE family protein n=1 Tax=Sedimentibacter hydroxybenzoicus DSM 7310 TaxID=1123245 RepID=A0A974GWX0_SEDHY|nr:sulfite exporter TauE/SafE family protein [Sedimentibacter hydroxybenzoicus]NYB74903.1 sulfite exporter TauE/SafE family protein [Sedimentibacter hydroxybenzoicus DSM 7310]
MMIKKEKIKVYDMTCGSCEKRVERAALNVDGVIAAKASYSGQFAEIEYDDDVCSHNNINKAINDAGYGTKQNSDYKFFGMVIIVAAILILGFNTAGFDMESQLNNASYAVLFIVGILTSIHCVGMCGGIMLSQTVNNESEDKLQAMKPALYYNAGRVLSYTVLGGIIGAVGSIFSLSFKSKAAVQIVAALFMIVMGLNMFGFSLFRKLQIKLPHSFCKFKNKSNSPFIVGLLNGFMPCGPLQTMQIFALGTGSPVKGALSMMIFSLGTVPLMLTFGAVSGLLSKGYTKRLLKLSGVMIIVLGIIMGNRGLSMLGYNLNPAVLALDKNDLSDDKENPNVAKAVIQDGVQIINMTVDNRGFTPNAFYVQKDIPVKWIIDGELINTCNNAIIIPSIDKEIKINKGENILEFTPNDSDMRFSCWMGMINGIIKVVDELDTVDTSVPDPSIPAPSTGPGCCSMPVDEDTASYYNPPSIYGDDISKVPTEMLIGKAENNALKISGIGYELQPLAAVVEKGSTTVITFDFTDFDNADGTYVIADGYTGEEITSFTAVKGINQVEITPVETSLYGIVKGNALLGIIEVVDSIDNIDLEEIRNYLIAE